MRVAFWLVVLLTGGSSMGCGRQASAKKPAPLPAEPGAAAGAKAALPAKTAAGPEARGQGYVWRATVEAEAHAGQPGKLLLQLTTQAPWHINEEYPLEIKMLAPAAVKLGKSQFAKPDAKLFAAEKATFEVPWVASVGQHKLEAAIAFAVCTAENCVPDEQTLAVVLDVQP